MGIFDRIDRLADQLGDLIVPDDVRAHVELGAAYLDRGDLDSVVRELTLATELRPDHPRASYLLGIALARKGDEDGAIESLARAANTKGGMPDALVALGELYRRQGDLTAATDAYRGALEGGLSDATLRGEVYRGLGAIYMRTGHLDKAVRELRKAVASTPEDGEAQGLLGRALYLRGDLDSARLCLERTARTAHPQPAALVALGEVYLRSGAIAEARTALSRALELSPGSAAADVEAHLALARLELAGGGLESARDQIDRALDGAPGRPDLLALRGRILAAAGDCDGALDAFDQALVGSGGADARLLFDRRPVLEEALGIALRDDRIARARPYADALLAERPDHGAALAARALAAAEEGALDEARTLVDRALSGAPEALEPLLAAADVAARSGQLTLAAGSLRHAAEAAPTDARPRARLAALYRGVWRGEPEPTQPRDLYALLSGAHRHLARCRELAELSPEAGRLVEMLDRPLLVTVMGEFNSGKSTFVNALLGEEVAPMGVTPTTATINVLKYGSQRQGRVVYVDDRTADIPWANVPSLLRKMTPEEARKVRQVEILYPLETLQQVNVVDTPGLNSIHPEHEETARRFIAEADAVVWLFTVDQAAKATEQEALDAIRKSGKKVLGVVNKIDRCTPEELQRILAHVEESFGAELETVVGCAARAALEARKANDPQRLAEAHFDALESALEERFFSRARAIKRNAARSRLKALLGRAQACGTALLPAHEERVAAALATVRAEATGFEGDFLDAERRRLHAAFDEVYAACAREVLDFVRPRRWPFGSNEASPADRDFVLALLDERLAALLEAARARVAEATARARTALRSAGADPDPAPALQLLDEQVYGRYRAFARGYLRGGRVDDFFTRALPKLELSAREVQRALERAVPASDDIIESELRAPLRAWGARYFAGLIGQLEHMRVLAELDRLDIEERVLAPVELLSSALEEIDGQPGT